MITAFLENDHREWDIHLAEFRFAYNTAYHTSLQATPAFLNFGREPQPVNTVRGRHESAVEVTGANPETWKERMERMQQALRTWVIENLEAAHDINRRIIIICEDEIIVLRLASKFSSGNTCCHQPFRIFRQS